MSALGDLLLTDAELAAVERHRAAIANYQADPREWREAWPGMVSAVIAGYQRRLIRSTFTGGSSSRGAQHSSSVLAAARRLPPRSMLDEPAFPGPGPDLDSVADAKPVLDAGQVGLHGTEGKEQLGGDLSVGAAFRDSPDDLDLPLRKGHDGLRHDRSLDRGEMPEQPEGDLRRDEDVAGVGGPDGLDEQGGAGILEHEADSPACRAP